MKKMLIIGAVTLVLIVITSLASANGPAVQIKEGGCNLINAEGGLFFDPHAAHAVYTDSETGNSMIVCKSWLPEGSYHPHKAVVLNRNNWGGWCSTFFGITYKFHNVVTPKGRVILTCHYNPSAVENPYPYPEPNPNPYPYPSP